MLIIAVFGGVAVTFRQKKTLFVLSVLWVFNFVSFFGVRRCRPRVFVLLSLDVHHVGSLVADQGLPLPLRLDVLEPFINLPLCL